jgi:hypothetical protein
MSIIGVTPATQESAITVKPQVSSDAGRGACERRDEELGQLLALEVRGSSICRSFTWAPDVWEAGRSLSKCLVVSHRCTRAALGFLPSSRSQNSQRAFASEAKRSAKSSREGDNKTDYFMTETKK